MNKKDTFLGKRNYTHADFTRIHLPTEKPSKEGWYPVSMELDSLIKMHTKPTQNNMGWLNMFYWREGKWWVDDRTETVSMDCGEVRFYWFGLRNKH